MRKSIWLASACLPLATLVAACDGDNTDPYGGEPSPIAAVEEIPAGDICEEGGALVNYGVDANRDGDLSDDEIERTVQVCNGDVGKDGKNGKDGDLSLVRVTDEAPGKNCAAGGQRFDVGLDDGQGDGTAGDGVLDNDEIDATAYTCNGKDGAAGEDGSNAIAALVNVSPEPPGSTCPDGGQKIDSGLDSGANGATKNDGVLDAGEIESTSYVCNGETGVSGAQGERGFSSLVKITFEPVGANCIAAGQRVDVGLDNGDGSETSSDGTLSSGEIDSTSYVCNGVDGVDGFAALARTSDATVQDCPTGGKQVDFGLDNGDGNSTARDGDLSPGEVDSTSLICNGVNGADGVNGSNGMATLVNISSEGPGAMCANGGQRIDSGVDNGDGAGIGANGTLEEDEIDKTSYVCNGTNGTDGSDGADGTNGTNGTNGFSSLVTLTAITSPCQSGGQRIDSGLDNGDNSGIARNGTLESGEIDFTRNVCNGTDGADGADGADGGGGGKTVVDAEGVVLGVLDAVSQYAVTVVSSTGYTYSVGWDGSFASSQIYFSGTSCTGTQWLNSATTTPRKIWGKSVIYSGGDSSLKVPTNVGSDGTATSAAGITKQSIFNNETGCAASLNATNNAVWELTTISAATAGIPSSIVPPFTIQ